MTGEIIENKNIKFNMRHGINECRRNLVLRKKDGCGCGKKLNESRNTFETGYWHGYDAIVLYNDGDFVTILVGDYSMEDAQECKEMFDLDVDLGIYQDDVITVDIDDWNEQNDEFFNDFEEEIDEEIDNSDLDDMMSLFEAAEKPACKCRYKGKLISKMDKVTKREAKVEVREEIKSLKKQIKEVAKAGKSTKALDAKLEKLMNVLDCLMGKCETEDVNESISSRFARKARLFEAEEEDDELADDEPADDEPATEDAPADEDPKDESSKDDDKKEDEDEFEDVEMKAVVLTVLKKDLDKVKDELVEAGISEDNIDMPECEDSDDDDECEIRVDAEAVAELAEYLKTKGIDLEEEIGGEIIADDSDDEPADEEPADDVADDEPAAEDMPSDDFSEEDLNDIFK